MPPDRDLLHRPPLIRPPSIRAGRDTDDYATLIARCWADYPNCILDIDAEAPELRALATYYAGLGGALWVAVADRHPGPLPPAGEGAVIGMAAVKPSADGWEVGRMYVHPDHHGGGLAHALLDRAEAYAAARGATRLVLWSDTKFHRAHRFYEKRGYARVGETRALYDLSDTVEYGFAKRI